MSTETKTSTLFPETEPIVANAILPINQIIATILGDKPKADLINSIKQVGVLVPILVQQIEGVKDQYQIVDGRRRYMAARDIGRDTIPVLILEAGVQNPEAFTLQANMTRRSNPISEHAAIKELIEKGYTPTEIAKQLGMKPATIKQRLALGDLIPVLYDLAETGYIAATVAEALAKLPAAMQEEAIKVFEKEDKITSNDVAELRRVKTDQAIDSLGELLFGEAEQEATDKLVAINHLKAAAEIMERLGLPITNVIATTKLLEAPSKESPVE